MILAQIDLTGVDLALCGSGRVLVQHQHLITLTLNDRLVIAVDHVTIGSARSLILGKPQVEVIQDRFNVLSHVLLYGWPGQFFQEIAGQF
jgi:hypothetical protein